MTTESADARKYYTLTLSLDDLDVKEGKSGPYALMKVRYTPSSGHNAGQSQSISAVCAGKAYVALRDELIIGATIRVSGQFEKSSDPTQAQTFRVVGRPLARQQAEHTTGPNVLVNGMLVPASEYRALVALYEDCKTIQDALTQPMTSIETASAEHPHIVAGRPIPSAEYRKFVLLLARCPALRSALNA